MHDWNVVVSIRGECFKQARRALARLGAVDRTEYYNVLALRVDDTERFLAHVRDEIEADPSLRDCLARVVPAARTFRFQSAEEFENRSREAVAAFIPELKGKAFHVRMHRRGFRNRLSSQQEERRLDQFLLESMDSNSHITFEDPDVIVAVETIGPWAGFSLWTREELALYPFLHLD